LYYGNWEYDDDPSTLIEQSAIQDYFNPIHVKGEGLKYMTIDVARMGKDKTVIRVWHGWLVIDRFEIAKSGLDEVVNKIYDLQRKHGVSASNTIADEDGVGGGLIDFTRPKINGFVNNSKALNNENYDNLKSQCSILMAKKIMLREVGEVCNDGSVRDITSEEMEQIKMKDIDKDGRLSIIPKDKIKEMIGRSPDEWDSIMMRYWFEVKPRGNYGIK
jgi:hypothetical protein